MNNDSTGNSPEPQKVESANPLPKSPAPAPFETSQPAMLKDSPPPSKSKDNSDSNSFFAPEEFMKSDKSSSDKKSSNDINSSNVKSGSDSAGEVGPSVVSPIQKVNVNNHIDNAQALLDQAKQTLSDSANGTLEEKVAAKQAALDLVRQAGHQASIIGQPSEVGVCPLVENESLPSNYEKGGYVGPDNPIDPRTCQTCGKIAPSHWFLNGQCQWAIIRGVATAVIPVVKTPAPSGKDVK